MRRCLRAATAAFLLLAPVVLTGRQNLPRSTPEAVGLSAERLRDATTLLQQFVADEKIAGAVAAVARNGRLAYLEAVGVQDVQTRAPMTPGSLFRIYSMTKPVTAVAVMVLHDEGRFSLGDPVTKYIPEFRAAMVVSAPGAAPAGARHHHRRPAAPHVRPEPSHLAAVSHRASQITRDPAADVHRKHRPDPAPGRSWNAVSLQRGDDRSGPPRRNLVGEVLRYVPGGASVPAAPDDRYGFHRGSG